MSSPPDTYSVPSVPEVPTTGNTLVVGEKVVKEPRKRWCFTLNNYSEKEYTDLSKKCANIGKYVIGKEIGENGTPHLQGYLELETKLRFKGVKEILGNEKLHIEACNGNRISNINYCTKDYRYISNFSSKLVPSAPKVISKEILYSWQSELLNWISIEATDRKIIWYYDLKGSCGKTSFAKYLCVNNGAIYFNNGKTSDIAYVACENPSNIYIFDLPRSCENRINYEIIESIKNGIFLSPKYESKMCIRNSPHVIIFANFLPEFHKLSEDRWDVRLLVVDSMKNVPPDITSRTFTQS